MHNNSSFEYIIKKNTANNIFINFSLSAKQFFYCLICNIVFAIVATTVTNTAYAGKVAAIHQTPFSFLMQHSSLPVEYLNNLYVPNTNLPNELSEDAFHPFFSLLEVDKKRSLARKSTHPHATYSDLNHFISYSEGVEYINQKKMTPLIQIPLFNWLLKEYDRCDYQDKSGTASPLKITIGGMLYDLGYRAQNDPVAKLVLAFLNRPYVKSTYAEPTDKQSFLVGFGQHLSQLFWPKKTELSFSERLELLGHPFFTSEAEKQKRLFRLKKQGYNYEGDYAFISYEPDLNGDKKPVSSDSIILPVKKSKKLLDADYPCLDSTDDTLSATNIMGAKSSGNSFAKTAALVVSGLCLFTTANASVLSAAYPPQCDTGGSCNAYNTYPLLSSNFPIALQGNPAGCFKLAENITLNTQHTLPIFEDCTHPFSGVFDTGDYTLNAGNGTSPIFGCIDKATVTGNFNFCPSGNAVFSPMIAQQVSHNNKLNIYQTNNCTIQRPLTTNIIGDNNQITFSAKSNDIRVRRGAGIIASGVSGNNNIITAKQGQSHNSPVVFTTRGNSNTYYQQDMNITRSIDRQIPDSKFLTASFFRGREGSKTTIVQNNIRAKFITNDRSQGTIQNRNQRIDVFSTDVALDVFPVEPMRYDVRLTNISENSPQRTIVKNHGRLEVFWNNQWRSLCEDTFGPRAAHTACIQLGYGSAQSEGLRLSFKDKLPVTTLMSSPIHLDRICFGLSVELKFCHSLSNSNTSPCAKNRETFLSCSQTERFPFWGYRLTDYTSNDADRLDTTHTGIGRLDGTRFGGDPFTFCNAGFNNSAVKVACNYLGFNGGVQIYPAQTPLSRGIQIFKLTNDGCLGDEVNLIDCPYQVVTTQDALCSHQNDVILQCNQEVVNPNNNITLRLTDRDITHRDRVHDISSTGIGRLEVLVENNNKSAFLPFCPENIADSDVDVICNQFGFDSGNKSYLTAITLPPTYGFDSENGTGTRFQCDGPDIANCTLHGGFLEQCSQPFKNVVLHCTHINSSLYDAPIIPKPCRRLQPDTTIFSGTYNIKTDKCTVVDCPVKLWDVNDVKLADNLYRYCNGEQSLDTTTQEDWLTAWNARCGHSSDHCNCHLHHEEPLGFVAKDPQYSEAFLVSRQTYPHNESINDQGLVLVRKLFSNEAPQALRSANEALVTGTVPVNHVITEQHLLGVYPTENDTSIQLFWSSLESNNSNYHAQTYDISGKPLLLTQESVFVKNTNDLTISQYQLNQTTNNNIKMFNLNNLPSDNINLPEDTTDVFAATLKNDWLYLATTNSNSTDQIYVIRYNIADSSWDSEREPVPDLTANNIKDYNIAINNYNQVQFLSRGQIPSTHPVLISTPRLGGCASFSKAKKDHTLTLPPPLMPPENEDEQQSSSLIAAAAAATAAAACVASSVGCLCGYCLHRKKDHLCKAKSVSTPEEENKNE